MTAPLAKSFAIVAVAALTTVFASSGLGAAENFDYGVVTTVETDDGQPRLLNLRSGDLVRSGAPFRVELLARTAGTLEVSFTSSQGEEYVLAHGVSVAAGDRLSLPSAEDWYYLDDVTGIERLTMNLSGESTEHVIRHVGSDVFDVAPNLDDLDTEGEMVAPMRGTAADEPIMVAPARLPHGLSGYHGALALLATAEDTLARGAKEAKLFRELSPGIVMIVSDAGIGSGAVITEDGLILTNWHVVQASDGFGVVFKPPLGQEVRPTDIHAGVIEKIDPELDLALVKVVNPPEELTVLELGEMSDIEVGLDVHAIGHPTGEGWTYTNGLISQVRPNYSWPSPMGFTHNAMVIQTQTPINPGSSGSPLISEDHKIIGINSFKKQGEALNFAVSVADIRSFLDAPDTEQVTPVVMSPAVGPCDAPSRQQDTNGDGKVDRTAIDTNCDGTVDMVTVDEDHDGQPDFALADGDGDGKPDLKMISSTNNGRFDLWLMDSDGDGTLDMVGYDEDYDGIIDRYTRG